MCDNIIGPKEEERKKKTVSGLFNICFSRLKWLKYNLHEKFDFQKQESLSWFFFLILSLFFKNSPDFFFLGRIN